MAQNYLLGALLMWAVLVVVAGALSRSRDWRQAPIDGGGGGRRRQEGAAGGLREDLAPAGVVGFVVLVVVVAGAALLGVGAGGLTALQGAAGTALLAVLGLLLVVYILAGVYVAARARGLGTAGAVAVGGWTFGLLTLVAVVVTLLVG